MGRTPSWYCMAWLASVENPMSILLQKQLDRVSYKDGYEFRGMAVPDSGFDFPDDSITGGELWLVRVEKPNNVDAETGGTRLSIGRWNVVIGLCAVEVARACLVAVKNFEEHEVHEFLRVDGERIFNPHGAG